MTQRRFYHSLRFRITATLFVIQIAIIGSIISTSFIYIEDIAHKNITKRHASMFKVLFHVAQTALFAEDFDDFQSYINSSADDPDIIMIQLRDYQSRIVADTTISNLGLQEELEYESPHPEHYWIHEQIGDFGMLSIEFSKTQLLQQIAKAQRFATISMLIGLLLSGVIAILASHYFTHRIGELQSRVRHFNAHSTSVPQLAIQGKDEIAQLSEDFQSMAIAINGYIQEMQQHQVLLEHRVEERTKELQSMHDELVRTNLRLEILATTDGLTGLMNRTTMESHLHKEEQQFQRNRNSYSIIMLDIDYFKKINDNFGHDTGDIALKSIASTLLQSMRQTDTISRWGGEEFLIFMPDTDYDGAIILAEKLRQNIAQTPVSKIGTVTASLGVTTIQPSDTTNSLLKRADNALYQAKAEGRNIVVGKKVQEPGYATAATEAQSNKLH